MCYRPENKVIAFKQVGWQLVADVECLALYLVNRGWCGEQQLPPRLREATAGLRGLDFPEPRLCPQGVSSTGWAASRSPQREAVHHQCPQSQVRQRRVFKRLRDLEPCPQRRGGDSASWGLSRGLVGARAEDLCQAGGIPDGAELRASFLFVDCR